MTGRHDRSQSDTVSRCENCGRRLAKTARFCPECGTRVAGGEGEPTAVVPPPPAETGPAPVEVTSAQPRLFGVTPPTALFGLAAAALALAIVFLAAGHWPAGILCGAAAVLLGAAFVEIARRKPDSAPARASIEAIAALRTRAGYALETLSTRSQAAREIAPRRQELLRLRTDRERALRDLGEAVYGADEEGAERERARVRELDETIAAREDEMQTIAQEAEERLRRARLRVAPTETVEVPEPAGIPEPAPSQRSRKRRTGKK